MDKMEMSRDVVVLNGAELISDCLGWDLETLKDSGGLQSNGDIILPSWSLESNEEVSGCEDDSHPLAPLPPSPCWHLKPMEPSVAGIVASGDPRTMRWP